jgi:hypothetical protein
MEQKLNIAEILKDKPVELKLYSSTFGYIKFNGVHKDKVYFFSEDTNVHSVKSNGKMYDSGECIIFPSKKMRDWSKFAWKKGDVLTNSSGFKVFFDKWVNEDYTKFLGKIKVLGDSHYYYYDTAYYILASKKEALEFIKSVEEINNGKLNLEISKIEKAQPKFKDGDILSCDEDSYTRHTTLILHKDENITESIVSLVRHKKLVKINIPIDNFLLSRLYPAREDEKKELFDALSKVGKAWDAEKKQIVDLKLKVEFKPFDKVLVRNTDTEEWFPGFFEKFDSTWNKPYHIMNRRSMTDFAFKQCIPYIGNESLLGTTNNVEG